MHNWSWGGGRFGELYGNYMGVGRVLLDKSIHQHVHAETREKERKKVTPAVVQHDFEKRE